MLAGGAISDRFSPRNLMVLSDITRTVLSAAIALLALTGHLQLWHLYVLALAFGAIDALFYPCASAIVPLLVPEEQLQAATALGEVSIRGSIFIGPALAGLVIAAAGQVTGSGVAFAVDAGSFLISAVAIVLIRGGSRQRATDVSGGGPEDGLLQSIHEGLRYAWNDAVVRYLLLIVAGIDVTLNGVFGVGLPMLARNHYAGGAAALGALTSGFGAGAILGVLIAGSIKVPRRRGLVTVGITFGFGLGTLLLPLMPNLGLAVGCMAGMAIGSGLANVIMMPWLQARTDGAMMGRVMSMFMLASFGLTPLAYAAAGWIASIDYMLLFPIGAAIIFLTASFALLNRTIRTLD
jgi:MFS family permease